MPPIHGTLTGTNQSPTFTSTKEVSDVIIDTKGCKGSLLLKVRAANTKWMTVASQSGSFDVLTPDTTLEYAFFAVGVRGTANFYMGP